MEKCALREPDDNEVNAITEQNTREVVIQEVVSHAKQKREPNVIYRINKRQAVQDEHGKVIIFLQTPDSFCSNITSRKMLASISIFFTYNFTYFVLQLYRCFLDVF